MIISNGKNKPLNAQSGSLPDMSGALQGYFQPMTFGVVEKVTEGFQVVETMVNVSFRGVIQPLPERKLIMKPEGQRNWDWYMIHAENGLILTNDQVFTYLDKQYRVVDQWNYTLYGYVEYHVVEDYTGSGPEVVTP